MSRTLRTLVVEHDPADIELMLAELRRAGYQVEADIADTAERFAALLDRQQYDVVLADYRLPQWTGMEALAELRARGCETPLILVTGTLGEERAVQSIKEGVSDYIIKSNLSRLPLAVARTLEETELRRTLATDAVLIRKLKLAVDQSPASVIITDTEGTIEYVNQRFTEITGYRSEEVLGQNPRILKSGLTPAETYRGLWRRIREGRVWHGELQNKRRSGELYWDASTISPIRDASGRITHYLAIQEDITERKRTEDELRERGERFRQLAEHISEVFFIMDADFRETLYINPAYERIWGRSCASLYQNPRSFMDQVAPEHIPRLMENIQRIREGQDDVPLEMRIVRPDGVEHWVLTHAVPIRNEKGEVYRISGVALEITERKQAEEALRQSERRLRTLFETVNLIVLALDANARVQYVNPYFLTLTGYRSEDAAEADWFATFVPPAERPALGTVFRELLEQGLHSHHQNPIITRSGEQRMISWHNTVLRDASGRPSGSLSIGEDVTEHNRLEEQYRQAQKMEAVGRLAGGVAHDFNNLLTVIMSYAAMLRDDLAREDRRQQDIEPIIKAAEGAAALTRQLLAFSRQEVIQPRVLALQDVVGQSGKLLRRVIGEDIALHLKLSPVPLWVMIDPGQVEQVIMNLAVNARDAMPQGGQLSIETEEAILDEEYARNHWPLAAGRFALLAVSDSGIGMDQSTQARIFEPFFTTKEVGKGTGLGLATVYGIVKQNGGFIWVYSEPGQGATFKVYLPLVEPMEEPAVTRADEAPRGGKEVILLAEDAAALRAVARQTLERYGYTVLEAPGAEPAHALAAKHQGPIDLLLTDVVMPEISGRQLAELCRARRPELRVLFMSGYTDDTITRHGVLQPGTAYLQKPFTPEVLARKVREVLDAPLP